MLQEQNVNDDIALLRTSRDVTFSVTLQPICLPIGEIFPDSQGEVFVAGWGVSQDRDCTTGTLFRPKHCLNFSFIGLSTAATSKAKSKHKYPLHSNRAVVIAQLQGACLKTKWSRVQTPMVAVLFFFLSSLVCTQFRSLTEVQHK